jgi:hypothetical protein
MGDEFRDHLRIGVFGAKEQIDRVRDGGEWSGVAGGHDLCGDAAEHQHPPTAFDAEETVSRLVSDMPGCDRVEVGDGDAMP